MLSSLKRGRAGMAREGFGKIRFFSKSGARLYIPQKIIDDSRFPFKDGEVLKVTIGDGSLCLESVEWWEMLDWKSMPEAYQKLPEEIQTKIRQTNLAPT